MAKTFMQLASEAMAEVKGLSSLEAEQSRVKNPNTLIVDIHDAEETRQTGIIPRSINISLGMLPVRSDKELPEEFRGPRLQDRSRPVITYCTHGPIGARGVRYLKDMGFTNVHYISGGLKAREEASLPIGKTSGSP
jgi:rhodanese-related sulfurtransferase